MSSLTRPCFAAPLGIVVALLVVVPVTAAQSMQGTGELRRLAESLASALPDEGVRLAVVPITDGLMPMATEIVPEITDRLRAALVTASADEDRNVAMVEPAEVGEAIRELQIPQALSVGGALLVGAFVEADYVVSGTLQRLDGGDGLLSVELLDVRTRRPRRTASTTLAATASGPVTTAQAGASGNQVATRARPTLAADIPTSSGGSSRGAVLSSGFVGAAVAAVLAVSKERELRMSRIRLVDIPAGAAEEWEQEFQHARDLERTRNLWLGAAIGAGGATLAYMLLTARTDDARASRAVRMPIPGDWTVRLNPIAPGVSLSAAF